MDVTSPEKPRFGVVDLGSNSVRLVVYEGMQRNPHAIFNEKAVLGLGRGLHATGRLNEEASAQTLTVLGRYHALAQGMGADPLEVLATAAVRDATNGQDFLDGLVSVMPGARVAVLSGDEEARLSAEGLLMGVPFADGVLGDLGGGSLELVKLVRGEVVETVSLPIGTIRLADRAEGDISRARAIVETELKRVPWLGAAPIKDLFLVGGTFRALARMHIAQTGYPLTIVHHYAIRREEARDLAGVVMTAPKKSLERMPSAPTKRVSDLPFAAVVMRRLLRASGAARVVFSANGLREGWYGRRLDRAERGRDPLLSAAIELGERLGRDQGLPAALLRWTEALAEEDGEAQLRAAACWISDTGSRDHPEYRAEQSFLRILRLHGVGLDHHARAFLALVAALRYEAETDSPWLMPARTLLSAAAIRRAEVLGAALRLAYTLCGGVPALLDATVLERRGRRLVLKLHQGAGVFAGESVLRRLEALALALGLDALLEVD
ncbi:Ppx/GppA family phosphatase [Roseococcus sp. SYP-B2431]|uniref:Ppx/GppA phosphatase family protein n=1 Tax=Roseococcus sp. SYP-B2431 TaxID=2496640 RepID=UPI0010386EA4|nr:Ppx/GppA family phosphatase [Roseococcus sp. SYP-B2431]TCH96029.1 Ppx/GppA family phosphatase [Roseococcus sp. SYP-B2431]